MAMSNTNVETRVRPIEKAIRMKDQKQLMTGKETSELKGRLLWTRRGEGDFHDQNARGDSENRRNGWMDVCVYEQSE